jgi:hypothetical protein
VPRIQLITGILKLCTRMQINRLKVFSHLNDWFEEFELLHRKDGVLVKERDDLMATTRYGIMMLQHARTPPTPRDAYTRSWRARRERGSWITA